MVAEVARNSYSHVRALRCRGVCGCCAECEELCSHRVLRVMAALHTHKTHLAQSKRDTHVSQKSE
jgi:hypothetical protein